MILILGATSGIAQGTARAFAKRGNDLYLMARDSEELEKIAEDLRIRYKIQVKTKQFDIEQPFVFPQENIGGVVFAVGYMGDDIQKVLKINFNDAVSTLESVADYFKNKKQGFIIGISSVAGDRGRQSNYIYGAAKSGLSIYLQGLRNKLHQYNIRVVTVKPGFVDTKMTFGLPGMFLVADPNVIGEKIAKAAYKGPDSIYLPWFWKYIMLIIKSIPERIFKKMNI